MIDKIKLYTSFPPAAMRQLAGIEVGKDYLAECVQSWRRADFDVVSLNNAEEIEAVSRLGLDVELRPISGSRPTIAEFLGTIRASESPVAAIINADVFMANHPDLLNAAADRGAGGMIMLERINIEPNRLRPTGQSCNGFDAFIFHTEPLARIGLDFEFLFGQPWWDYWLPLAYAAAGGKLMKIEEPILFHLDHPQKWNQGQWIANGQKTVRYFLRSSGELPEEFAAEIAKFDESSDMSEDKLGPFSHWCFAKLRAMAEVIPPSHRPDSHAPLSDFVGFLDNANSRSLVGELNEAHARLAAMKEIVEASLSIWGAAVEVCSSFGDKQLEYSSSSAVRSKQPSDPQQRTPLPGNPISNYEDLLQTISSANRIMNSRKAILAHFVALNVSWIRRKWLDLHH
jgi:hypothetical protein